MIILKHSHAVYHSFQKFNSFLTFSVSPKRWDSMSCKLGVQNVEHKEEKPGRIKSDRADREKLRAELSNCVDSNSHPREIVNISTRSINKDTSVNVENAVSIGYQQLKSFINELPESFAKSIERKVVVPKKRKKMCSCWRHSSL